MLNKLIAFILTLIIAINPVSGLAQESADPLDEPIKDISIVLGTGVVGALLGLSTLSFVDEPDEHLKNIAIGGAIGIVIGVGVVIFSQATKTQSMTTDPRYSMSANEAESLSRLEFAKDTYTAKNQLPATFGYNVSF
jgi:capsular polysaccharide biosynthesis protein